MAKRKARRRKSVPGRQTPTLAPGIRRISRPRSRQPHTFEALDAAISAAKRCFLVMEAGNPYEFFQVELFNRAFNSLKAIRLLLESSYWEAAASVSRQMFELSLNVERIIADKNDPELAAIRFLQFGLFQKALRLRTLATHFPDAPSAPVDETRAMSTDSKLEEEFPQFIGGRRRDGSPRWMESWCDMTVKKMVETSLISARVQQYELLYRSWSEQVHSSPGALIMNVFVAQESDLIECVEREEDKRIAEIGANSISILCEIWTLLPASRPSLEGYDIRKWFELAMMSPLVNRVSHVTDA